MNLVKLFVVVLVAAILAGVIRDKIHI